MDLGAGDLSNILRKGFNTYPKKADFILQLCNRLPEQYIADETELNENNAIALLLGLTGCLIIVLASMTRAVYRQNRRLEHEHKLTMPTSHKVISHFSAAVLCFGSAKWKTRIVHALFWYAQA